VPHPTDVNYGLLKADLKLVHPGSEEHDVIKVYLNNTMGPRKVELYDIWSVNREGEKKRFSAHDSLSNRRLLWHGTN
ncbi:unnamed protein product, partial [Discosporangium mesarthrocarpum]